MASTRIPTISRNCLGLILISTVLIVFPGEAATGVVCPRETGEMKIDDCRECPNFKPCMSAIVEEGEEFTVQVCA